MNELNPQTCELFRRRLQWQIPDLAELILNRRFMVEYGLRAGILSGRDHHRAEVGLLPASLHLRCIPDVAFGHRPIAFPFPTATIQSFVEGEALETSS